MFTTEGTERTENRNCMGNHRWTQMNADTGSAAFGRVGLLRKAGGGMTNDEVPNDEGSSKPEARGS